MKGNKLPDSNITHPSKEINTKEKNMPEKRIGNQTPTQSLVLPYKKTIGAEAIKAYEKIDRRQK